MHNIPVNENQNGFSMIVLFLIVVIISVVGVSGWKVWSKDNATTKRPSTAQQSSESHNNSSKPKIAIKDLGACEALTLEDAKKILGASARAAEDNGKYDARTIDVDKTDCFYSSDDPSLSNSAHLWIRSPLSSKGISDIKNLFLSSKSSQAENLSGYGDEAYYDPFYGKLNILVGGVWFQISSAGRSVNSFSVERAKAVADIILPKLQSI